MHFYNQSRPQRALVFDIYRIRWVNKDQRTLWLLTDTDTKYQLAFFGHAGMTHMPQAASDWFWNINWPNGRKHACYIRHCTCDVKGLPTNSTLNGENIAWICVKVCVHCVPWLLLPGYQLMCQWAFYRQDHFSVPFRSHSDVWPSPPQVLAILSNSFTARQDDMYLITAICAP